MKGNEKCCFDHKTLFWQGEPCPTGKYCKYSKKTERPRLGRIEIQCRSNLDRRQFLCLYLCRRDNFWVSRAQKTLFHKSKDTLNVSKIHDTVSVSISPNQFSCIGNSLAHLVGEVVYFCIYFKKELLKIQMQQLY